MTTLLRPTLFYWTEALRSSALGKDAKLVGLVLATHMRDGECFASQATLMLEASISKNGLKAAIRELEAAEMITYVASVGRGNATTYKMALPGWMPQTRPAAGSPERQAFEDLRAVTTKGSTFTPTPYAKGSSENVKGSQMSEKGHGVTPNSHITTTTTTTTPPTPPALPEPRKPRGERVVSSKSLETTEPTEAVAFARPAGVSPGVWQTTLDVLQELETRMHPEDWMRLKAEAPTWLAFKAWTWMVAGSVQAGRRSALLDHLLLRVDQSGTSYATARSSVQVMTSRTREVWEGLGQPRPTTTKTVEVTQRVDVASVIDQIAQGLAPKKPAASAWQEFLGEA